MIGGSTAVEQQVLEVDAAVCGEPEALREMEPGRVAKALDAAAAGGRTSVVEMLLARGASPNQQDSLGCTALMYVTAKGHASIVRRLLAAISSASTGRIFSVPPRR